MWAPFSRLSFLLLPSSLPGHQPSGWGGVDKKDPCAKQLALGQQEQEPSPHLPCEHRPPPLSPGLPPGLSQEQEEAILRIWGGVPDSWVLSDTALS